MAIGWPASMAGVLRTVSQKHKKLNVHTAMDMIFDYDAAPEAVRAIAERNRTVNEINWTRVALPNHPYRRRWMFTVEPPKRDVFVFPVIVGCITYRILPDKSIHQTGFVFHLFHCPVGDPHKFVGPLRYEPEIASRARQIGWDGGSGGFAD